MKPLKISARLSSPLAGDPPMLDALLEWAMCRKMEAVMSSSNGHRHITRTRLRPDELLRPGAVPIPIQRQRVAGFEWPVPCCSSPIFVARSDGVDHYARRFDVDGEMIRPDDRRVFYSNSGEFKSFRLPLRIRSIERIVWFALGRGEKVPPERGGDGVKCKGGAAEVRHLLKHVTHLGKKTSFGYGRVAEWTVEIVEQDWSWFAPSPAGTVLMRPLPASAVPPGTVGARPWFGGIVAPYWDSTFLAEGFVPC